jgi:DNA helicase-2/ATP-dependent DNA helicase PcrA
MNEIKAVIFDVDGTLTDTEKYYFEAWPKALLHFGYKASSEIVLQMRSLGRPFAVERFKEWFGPDFDYFKVREYRRELVQKLVEEHGIPLKPGVHEILAWLKKQGIVTAIATANDRGRTAAYLKKIGLDGCFDMVFCADMVEFGKPAPDIYAYACRGLSLDPSLCMAVEDSPNGVKSAYAAGCRVVMVPDLTEPDEEIKPMLYACVDGLVKIKELIGEKEMSETINKDNEKLIEFWNKRLELSDEDKKELEGQAAESFEEVASLAPSEKLVLAAKSLGECKKVLDYGCGTGWAGIIAAKSGCADVTAVDVCEGPAGTARVYAKACGVDANMHISCVSTEWLESVETGMYDGFICSNVLDVIPDETADRIIKEAARVTGPGAKVIFSFNYYISPQKAKERGIELTDGRRLYEDGVLRLNSWSDREWEERVAPFFEVEKLEYFAWPGEQKESRRLFYLKKR